MDDFTEVLRHLPASGLAGALVPAVQFSASKLAARRFASKKQRFRERVIALNAFIASMKEIQHEGGPHGECLQDALRERDLVVEQLATLAAREVDALTGFCRGTQLNGCFSCICHLGRSGGCCAGPFSRCSS